MIMALEELVATVLEVEPASVDDATSAESLDRWDSLAHVTLITAVEETYDVILSTHEMRDARSVGELRRILRDKGVAA
jgi:acyl carrier protein